MGPLLELNYPLIKLLLDELNDRIAEARVIRCLPNNLVRFHILFKDKSLFFCFAPPFIRFHFSSHRPDNADCHPLNAFLQNAIFKGGRVLQEDRIVQLSFQTEKGTYFLVCEFFLKHPNYYLIQSDGKILYSLYPLPQSHYHLPQKPQKISLDPTPPFFSHKAVEKAFDKLEKEWAFSQEKKRLQSKIVLELKKLRKHEREILEKLHHCRNWEQVQHEGELIKSHYSSIPKGASTALVYDWLKNQQITLVLDPQKSAKEEMEGRYKKAKKLNKGIEPLSCYLQKVKENIHHAEEKKQLLDRASSMEELAPFAASPKRTKQKAHPASPIYKEFTSLTGMKIWVGKNAKANDKLTFILANGNDWWLHVRDYAGSHVLIRTNKEKKPDPETLKDAMQLALYFSKANSAGEGEISITQRKYVKKMAKPGQVQISAHQSAWIKTEPDRIRRLIH